MALAYRSSNVAFHPSATAVLDETERTPPTIGSVHGESYPRLEPTLTRTCDPTWLIRNELMPEDGRYFPQRTSVQGINCSIAAHCINCPFLWAILEVEFADSGAKTREAAAIKEKLESKLLSCKDDGTPELSKRGRDLNRSE